jgi:quinoprotein glucose dehydrogenase
MKANVLLARLGLSLFAGITAAAAQTLQLEPFERLPTPVIDPASEDAVLALKRFSLPAGLEASLWAAEPMLANPVAIDFDERGRLFVSETYRYRTSVLDIRGYMGMLEQDMALRTVDERLKLHRDVFGEAGAKQLAIEGEVVRLVEDTDGDGKADKTSVYADGFNTELDGIASGVLARYGKVYFTNIPSLWLLEGQPGNVKKTELLRGFGVRYNYTGHDFHGLALGHDGKLYFSIGDRGMHVKRPDGGEVDFPDEGAVFRSNLDGTELEIVHRGLRNPQELVFDEHGNLFTGDNDSDQTDMERLVYLVEGGDSGWRVGYQHAPRGRGGPWIREGLWKPAFAGRPAYLLPPVCNIEDGPSGLTYYPGTGLSPEYAGHFFITHFKGSIARSGIQTYTLKENGAGFVPTSSRQFMGGVLPTDVTFGPDGVLYLSDWVDGWPKSQKGRIYGIKPAKPDPAQRKISADLAKLLARGFTGLDTAALAALLSHADRRARLEAQLELAARGPKSIAVFARVANDPAAKRLARLHAVWGLTQLGRKDTKVGPMLLKLLADGDAEVRAQAAKGLGDLGHRGASAEGVRKSALPALVKALADGAPRVQFFAAQSLGKLGDEKATAPLLELLRRNADRDAYLRHAAAHALAGIGDNAALEAAIKDASPAVRLGALLAYRELEEPILGRFLRDADEFIVREAAIAINDVPIPRAIEPLAGKLASARPTDEALVSRTLNANFRAGGAERAQALANYSVNDKATPEMRAEALMQLGLWGKVPQRDRIIGVYRPLAPRDAAQATAALSSVLPRLLGEAPEPVQLAAIGAMGSLELKALSAALVGAVGNEKTPPAVRVAALQLLDRFGGDDAQRGLELAQKSGTPQLRLAALQVVARRAPAQALPIVRRLAIEGTESEQRAAFQSMAQLGGAEAPKLLTAALERLAAGKVAPGAQVELIEAVEKSSDAGVTARWQKLQATWAAGRNPLAPYSFALAGGDPERGARTFFGNPVIPCARCHLVNGDGGEAGPDLSTIGREKAAEYLLESVIRPSAHIAQGFDIVSFTLQNGETETGSVTSESAGEIVVKRADGSTVKLNPAQVKQRTAAPSSMPEIYAQVLSRAELRDLVAYMRSLQVRQENTEDFGVSNRAMATKPKDAAAGGHP